MSLALQRNAHVAGPPSWVMLSIAGFALLACLIAGVLLLVWSARHWQPRDDGDDDESGGTHRADPPAPITPPDGDPVWWPEFERQLAAYVAARARVRQDEPDAAQGFHGPPATARRLPPPRGRAVSAPRGGLTPPG